MAKTIMWMCFLGFLGMAVKGGGSKNSSTGLLGGVVLRAIIGIGVDFILTKKKKN